MKNYYLIVILLTVLGSCKDKNVNYFLFERADGLSESSKVLMNGKVIGKVLEISISRDYHVFVKCEMNDMIGIPIDSDIKIKPVDILGTKCIYISPGISKEIANESDTIAGTFEEYNILDSIIIKGAEIIDEVLDEVQRDIDTLARTEY